eukprot:Colp12_sorted_trinity150504_noHs@17698
MVVKNIATDEEFPVEIQNAGTKLVVVDFYADWCGPCQRIAPAFEQLSNKYPEAVFLKVNTDKCSTVAAACGVRAMPTFQFFRNLAKLDEIKGADPTALENAIRRHYQANDADTGKASSSDAANGGHASLVEFIERKQVECLNESDDHTAKYIFEKNDAYLESDCDEQLLLSIPFNTPVKIHSIKFTAPDPAKAPKTVKIFANVISTLSFESAESGAATQVLTLTAADFDKDAPPIALKYVKFQNVRNVTLFFPDNQGKEDTTAVSYIGLFGTPLQATNMKDFKRVAGQEGETHD